MGTHAHVNKGIICCFSRLVIQIYFFLFFPKPKIYPATCVSSPKNAKAHAYTTGSSLFRAAFWPISLHTLIAKPPTRIYPPPPPSPAISAKNADFRSLWATYFTPPTILARSPAYDMVQVYWYISRQYIQQHTRFSCLAMTPFFFAL